LYTGEVRGKIRWPTSVKRIAEGGAVRQELEPALDITADVSYTDKPPKGITGNRGNLPSKFKGDRKLFVGDQPRESVRPSNSVHQGCEVWRDICVEGRVIFGRVGVVILAAVCTIDAGEVIGTLDTNKVDLVKVGIYGVRSEGAICPNRGTDQGSRRELAGP
jgi:hypothetical protein